MRQADVLLLHSDEMRGQNHAAGVSGPVLDVERGVVFREVGVASVAEDAFDEIQIAHQAGWGEEADFHCFGDVGLGCGADQRAQQQGDEESHLLFLICGERQAP